MGREHPQVKREFDVLRKELQRGDATGLMLQCMSCGSRDHLSKDCPVCPVNFAEEAAKLSTKEIIEVEAKRWKEKGQCACGNIFMIDSNFCRRCGAKRGEGQL